MIQDISSIKATRIVGGVGCGKTQQLIGRVCSLLSGGEKAGNVLVLCATPQACESFTLRLNAAAEEAGVNADEVAVTTPRALALEVLSDTEAVRWSGREPRLLTAYEELFLLEDMKVSGLRPKRLREMLKFFYRSWTELADDDPNWLLPGEESNVHTLLKDNLALTRSIVEPEAGNLAVNYLRGHAGAVAAHSFAHVLVDDYQRISKASQLLAGLMATETLTIAGDRTACVQVYDSYPYAAGLDEFMDAHEGAEDIELSACHACAAGASGAAKLLADPAMQSIAFHAAEDVAAVQMVVLERPLPEDEFGAAYEAGLALIESAAGLEGTALLDKLAELVTGQEGATAPGIVSTLCLGEQDNSAAAMAERFRNRLLAPRIDSASAVQVVPYDQVAGLSPKVLIISGFVNGFIPCREYFDSAEMPLDKQEEEHAKDARRVYAMAGKASEQLVISRFTTTSLETAGVMKLHIGRIRLQDGKRMCAIEPSDFIEQLA